MGVPQGRGSVPPPGHSPGNATQGLGVPTDGALTMAHTVPIFQRGNRLGEVGRCGPRQHRRSGCGDLGPPLTSSVGRELQPPFPARFLEPARGQSPGWRGACRPHPHEAGERGPPRSRAAAYAWTWASDVSQQGARPEPRRGPSDSWVLVPPGPGRRPQFLPGMPVCSQGSREGRVPGAPLALG